jgi:non-specific serine/threonine protein kinase
MRLAQEIKTQLQGFPGSVQDFLQKLSPDDTTDWNLVGRVCFHLVENKQNQEYPFAFLATYAHKVTGTGKAQHLPLGRALQEYSQDVATHKHLLTALLKPVELGAQKSLLLRKLLDQREIFHPLAWTPDQALNFLREVPAFEASGIVTRVPDWWKGKTATRPEIQVTIGQKKPSGLGFDSLMEFDVQVSLGGEPLTAAEWEQMARNADGLVSLRGQWVEIDHGKLSEVLEHWRKVQASVGEDGISFAEAMRLLAGTHDMGPIQDLSNPAVTQDWSQVIAGDWLAQTLEELRSPSGQKSEVLVGFKATLRPYQEAGLSWLWLIYRLRLGACLADDMGLGKTLQILALLTLKKQQSPHRPSLLVVPASLLGNWQTEADRFTKLDMFIYHPAFLSPLLRENDEESAERAESADITVTTYGLLSKTPWIATTKWDLVVLDEAQAIKNPSALQTKAVKALKAHCRIALTGTPIENHLSDLWSLFDFICPGLLGSPKKFKDFLKSSDNPYPILRKLIQTYILRRLKTDRAVINDLPEKTEVKSYCHLTTIQAALYQKAVVELAERIEQVEGIHRRGIILASLIKFKQICNHPSQWLGDGRFEVKHSGKMSRLVELGQEIAERQEKVLVFTQFREMTEPLALVLQKVFGREGLVLSGETAIKKRKQMVEVFQDERGPPFFVLSLKAGGTGLNLTAASHVIHFDRWWNPAVENQATDRAFRIGQKRNVLVHKFVCRGTIEEKIDQMLDDKKQLAAEILEGGAERHLTELTNEELLNLVSLDMNQVIDS